MTDFPSSPVSARATELADYIEQSTPPTYMEDVMLDRSDRELVIAALRGHTPTPAVSSIKDFVRAGISEFKEHELREIVATFCKLPGIAPQPAAQDATILSLVRVWRECPAERRPSAAALADRIIAALVDTSTLRECDDGGPCYLPECSAHGCMHGSDSSPDQKGK